MLDSNDKKRFKEFCSETDMNVSVAINMFIKAVLRESRLPFPIECDIKSEYLHSLCRLTASQAVYGIPYTLYNCLLEDHLYIFRQFSNTYLY